VRMHARVPRTKRITERARDMGARPMQ